MKLKLAIAGFAVIAAACGSAVADIAPTTTTMDPGSDMGDMNMGGADATPAAEAGGDLVTGSFRVLESAPDGFAATTGTADLARHELGTTVTIDFDNLIPDTEYVAHVHSGSCFDDGGPHYQFEVGGSVMPPNEIHLAFTSHADGSGFMTALNLQVAGPEATSVVVHEKTLEAPKIACADLS